MSSPLGLALFSCALLGFRHGFDYDHIAAITDITGVQTRASDAMRLGLMYALGHAATVAVLGSAVIFLQLSLPHGIDRWAERAVGLTLIVLALYVLSTLVSRRGQNKPPPKSRAALLIGAVRWAYRRLSAAPTGKDTSLILDRWNVNAPAAFGIGIIHGLGAETPSQLALFLLAANLGGKAKGFLGLAVFLGGLLLMNTLMAASAAGLFTTTRREPRWMPVLTGLTAVYSLCIGVIFLFGSSGFLPSISG
jgi:high-affinity nickel permease